MSLRESDTVAEQLTSGYLEEAVLDQLGWLYEEQIRHLCADISGLLPGYRQRVDEATYAREKQAFLVLLGHAREDFLNLQELVVVCKRLAEKRQVFAETTCQAALKPDGRCRRLVSRGGGTAMQVETEHRVY